MKILKKEPLKNYTYTKIGGLADNLIFVRTIEDIKEIIKSAKINNLPLTILGNGSNVLIDDQGLKGYVINTTLFNKISINKNLITVQAGCNMKHLAQVLLEKNYTGFEFASGIPGTIGGGTYMNAGAYGNELKNIIVAVKTIDLNNKIHIYKDIANLFNYRSSIFQINKQIILEVTFKLNKGNYNDIKAEMNRLKDLREAKQPLEYPSCGSVFKRPNGHYVGKLISEANLQGFTINDAQISLKHAGFIINLNQATCNDYLQVIKHIQTTIKEKYQVDLECEVKYLSNRKDK